ncbi:ABC transporter permease subunit [Symbiobacterium terraclitae]|uniref:ABC transporter permease subunit n=1 Tax=Symbiobacterium terraclitae TaxID=557451 RepID=UPI0035B56559
MALLVLFIVLIATVPPFQVTQAPDSLIGFTVRVDLEQWGQTLREYLQTLASGTLGANRRGHDVAGLLLPRLANTLRLIAISLALALPLGMVKGLRDFQSLRRRASAVGPLLTGLLQGVPDFFLVMLLQTGVAQLFQRTGVRLLPVAWDDLQPVASMVLPVTCLALLPLATVARITTQAMTNVYEQDYIRTARAKGLPERVVVYKHALAGALVPILDAMPGVLTVVFSNALIVERLFHYPGVTNLLQDAASPLSLLFDLRRSLPPPDVPVLVAAGASLGLIFALLYAVVSILRRVADPRLRGRDLP